MINILLPDEVQGEVYRTHVKPHLKPGNLLMCSHGSSTGQVEAPPGVDTVLVAPKGPGHLVRSEFERGGGVPCLIALEHRRQRAPKKLDWPTPRGSAARGLASLKPRLLKRRKPTYRRASCALRRR